MALLFTLLTACGAGPVQVAAPSPPAPVAALCRTLRERLPAKLHDQERRATEPKSEYVVAWGSPAIALRCGVPRPAALHPTSQLVTINGVNWLPQPPDRPVTFTAVGRRAYVEVTVPAKYQPPGEVLIDLTGAITSAIPATPDGSL